jgi:SynChlorMet cassette radical SAM/SPASM protein ScmE
MVNDDLPAPQKGAPMPRVMRTPRSVAASITTRCNLRCRYCFHFDSPGDIGQDLPTGEWTQFFDELGRCAVVNVCLSGGEPFIREDLPELIQAIVRNRLRYSLLSNGTLITDEIAAFIAATKRCSYIQVSIDGSIATTHDAFRGEGNFARAVAGIKRVMRHKIPATVRVTIHRHNVRELESIARFLLEEIGLPEFSTNSASYLGLCRQNSDQVMLTPEERTIAMKTLLALLNKYPGRINATAGPLADAKMWLEMVRARKQGKERIAGRGFLCACSGPFNKMAVRADGVMVPCEQMSHIEVGRINRDSLAEVWQNHPEFQRIRERHLIPLESFEFCRGCTHISYCTGNCPALAYAIIGQENHPSPDACLRRFLDGGGELPDESLLRAAVGRAP